MVTLAPDLRSVANQDGAVILNSPRCQITTLDVMGGYVWLQLQEGMTPDEIVRHLSQETGEDMQTIQGDVQAFVEDLASRRLLVKDAVATSFSEAL